MFLSVETFHWDLLIFTQLLKGKNVTVEEGFE